MTSPFEADAELLRDEFEPERKRPRRLRRVKLSISKRKLFRTRSSVIGIVILLLIGLGASISLQVIRDHERTLNQTEDTLNAQVTTLALALRGVANAERLARVVQDSVAQLPEGMALGIVGSHGDLVVSSTGERALQAALGRLARDARRLSSPLVTYVETLDDRQVLGAAAAIPGTDLVLTAGSPVSYILTSWKSSLPFYIMLLIGPAIMMLALAILLVREMERTGALKACGNQLRPDGGPARHIPAGDRTKLVMSAAPIGIALWDRRGRLIEANERFKTHMGASPAELTLDELDRDAGLVPAGLADEMAVTGFANLSESGSALVRRGPLLLLKNKKALTQGETLIATIDVSGLRNRSEAFARAEQDLSSERARAEIAEQERSGLFASASHELRTPLNAILGFSEIMKDGVLGPLGHDKYAEYARDIHESGHRLLRLVDGILTMSEIEKGETSLQLGPVDPTAIASECLVDLGEFAKDRNVDLIGRLILVPDVYADAAALRQIFIHLITNALKRAAPGGRVEMGCESGAEDVRFTLRNLGAIASEIDLKRATLSAGNSKSNAGLGLVIAKSLIQLQGGELTATNEADGSVSVGFTLPRQSAVSRRERAA